MGGTVTFLCPSALYTFCYQAGVTLSAPSFINYYGVECQFINLQGQIRCKCRHKGWGCADLNLTESGWFRWTNDSWNQLKGNWLNNHSCGAHTQTKQVNKQMDGIMICMKHIATSCFENNMQQFFKTEFCPQHLTCIEYILTAYHIFHKIKSSSFNDTYLKFLWNITILWWN